MWLRVGLGGEIGNNKLACFIRKSELSRQLNVWQLVKEDWALLNCISCLLTELIIVKIRASWRLVYYQSTRSHVPEDCQVQHRCDNVRYRNVTTVSSFTKIALLVDCTQHTQLRKQVNNPDINENGAVSAGSIRYVTAVNHYSEFWTETCSQLLKRPGVGIRTVHFQSRAL